MTGYYALSHQICLDQSEELVMFVHELGWVINFQKSELTPTQHFNFLSYRLNLTKGEVSPTEKIRYFDKGDRGFTNKFNNHSQYYNVFHRGTGLSRKDSPNGQITHEAISVVPKTHQKYSNCNSTFIALNLHLLTDSKVHNARNQRL